MRLKRRANQRRYEEKLKSENHAAYTAMMTENKRKWRAREDNAQKERVRNKRAMRVRNETQAETLAGSPRAMQCVACGREGKTVFDHCHKQNKFRGWLCQGCNKALGHVKDDPKVLRALADYLEQYQ